MWEALSLVDAYQKPASPRLEFRSHAGEGCAATEASRGTLYHRYRINHQGLVESAKIVPPTAQNLRRMEDDLRQLLPRLVHRQDGEILGECEKNAWCVTMVPASPALSRSASCERKQVGSRPA
jgi:coenzyme F420-reducing hydrogenase alpha subunit